jgi:hypothetical protein
MNRQLYDLADGKRGVLQRGTRLPLRDGPTEVGRQQVLLWLADVTATGHDQQAFTVDRIEHRLQTLQRTVGARTPRQRQDGADAAAPMLLQLALKGLNERQGIHRRPANPTITISL